MTASTGHVAKQRMRQQAQKLLGACLDVLQQLEADDDHIDQHSITRHANVPEGVALKDLMFELKYRFEESQRIFGPFDPSHQGYMSNTNTRNDLYVHADKGQIKADFKHLFFEDLNPAHAESLNRHGVRETLEVVREKLERDLGAIRGKEKT